MVNSGSTMSATQSSSSIASRPIHCQTKSRSICRAQRRNCFTVQSNSDARPLPSPSNPINNPDPLRPARPGIRDSSHCVNSSSRQSNELIATTSTSASDASRVIIFRMGSLVFRESRFHISVEIFQSSPACRDIPAGQPAGASGRRKIHIQRKQMQSPACHQLRFNEGFSIHRFNSNRQEFELESLRPYGGQVPIRELFNFSCFGLKRAVRISAVYSQPLVRKTLPSPMSCGGVPGGVKGVSGSGGHSPANTREAVSIRVFSIFCASAYHQT